MIKHFVDRWRDSGVRPFLFKHPANYAEIVKAVVEVITQDEDDTRRHVPDPERIHEIDDGDYQGTLLFVIGAKGYQPSTYWYVKVGYGSCSGCDTLDEIRSQSYNDTPTVAQEHDYMTLGLHIVEGLKLMGEEYE